MAQEPLTEIFDTVINVLVEDDEEVDKETLIKELINILEAFNWIAPRKSDFFDHPLVEKCFRDIHPDWHWNKDKA